MSTPVSREYSPLNSARKSALFRVRSARAACVVCDTLEQSLITSRPYSLFDPGYHRPRHPVPISTPPSIARLVRLAALRASPARSFCYPSICPRHRPQPPRRNSLCPPCPSKSGVCGAGFAGREHMHSIVSITHTYIGPSSAWWCSFSASVFQTRRDIFQAVGVRPIDKPGLVLREVVAFLK